MKDRDMYRSFCANIPKDAAELVEIAKEKSGLSETEIISSLMSNEVLEMSMEDNNIEDTIRIQARIRASVLDRFKDYASNKKYTMNELIILLIRKKLRKKEGSK